MPKQHPAQTAANLVRRWEDCPAPHDLPKWAEEAALTLRALLAQPAAPATTTVTLTALNLRNALDFVAPDFEADEDQRGTEVTIGWAPDRTSTEGEHLAAGYYCWLTDYSEEGCIPLDQGEWHPPSTTTEERQAAQAQGDGHA